MTVKYNIMSYLIGEGFKNVLKNKKSTVAALTIMCMAMLMFGLFFILGENVNYVMAQVEAEQGMQAYIDIDATDEQIKEIETKIRAIDGVNTIEYVSSLDAYNSYKENLGEYAEVLDGLEEILPPSYIITLTDLDLNNNVQNQISQIDHITEINSSNQTINVLGKITRGVRIVTFAILVILVLISIFIITNTIKLTVHSRRKEISIMKYVGATNSFIRWPFIVEGIIIGLVSALISILVIGLLYNVTTGQLIKTETFAVLNLKLYTFADMFNLLIITYILLGAGIGVVGSSISMRKYLEV